MKPTDDFSVTYVNEWDEDGSPSAHYFEVCNGWPKSD